MSRSGVTNWAVTPVNSERVVMCGCAEVAKLTAISNIDWPETGSTDYKKEIKPFFSVSAVRHAPKFWP